jgi:hypothetical protein
MTAMAVGAMFASVAHGSVIYSYVTGAVGSGSTSAQTTSFTTSPSTPVVIPIYLQETLTNGSTSVINGDGGLFGAGCSVTQSTAGTGYITATAGASGIDAGTFSSSINGAATFMQFGEYENLTNAGNGIGITTNAVTGGGQIQIGSVTIDPTVAGTYSYQLAWYNYPATSDSQSTATVAGDTLDGSNGSVWTGAIASGAQSFTVTATVPEPASLSLLGFASLGLLIRRRARRQA